MKVVYRRISKAFRFFHLNTCYRSRWLDYLYKVLKFVVCIRRLLEAPARIDWLDDLIENVYIRIYREIFGFLAVLSDQINCLSFSTASELLGLLRILKVGHQRTGARWDNKAIVYNCVF